MTVVSENGCRAGCFGELTLLPLPARQATPKEPLLPGELTGVERIHLDRVRKVPESSSSRQNQNEFFPSLFLIFLKDIFILGGLSAFLEYMYVHHRSGWRPQRQKRESDPLQVVLQTCKAPCGFWE